MDYDRTAMPAAYDAGRGLTPAQQEFWLGIVASSVGARKIGDILDLGCGTGRFSAALAAHFDARVVAVDPSEKMLAEARRKASARVRFARGSGEDVPLDDAAVDLVFISMAFHHFEKPPKAAAECLRVLRPGGFVFLRTYALEEIESCPYVPFFPRTRSLLAANMQDRAFIRETFAGAGFETARHDVVMSEAADSWDDYAGRLAHRADSILIQLTDAEFEQGLAALRRHAASADPAASVRQPVDVFVFRRP